MPRRSRRCRRITAFNCFVTHFSAHSAARLFHWNSCWLCFLLSLLFLFSLVASDYAELPTFTNMRWMVLQRCLHSPIAWSQMQKEKKKESTLFQGWKYAYIHSLCQFYTAMLRCDYVLGISNIVKLCRCVKAWFAPSVYTGCRLVLNLLFAWKQPCSTSLSVKGTTKKKWHHHVCGAVARSPKSPIYTWFSNGICVRIWCSDVCLHLVSWMVSWTLVEISCLSSRAKPVGEVAENQPQTVLWVVESEETSVTL